jgi:hypothetical protein
VMEEAHVLFCHVVMTVCPSSCTETFQPICIFRCCRLWALIKNNQKKLVWNLVKLKHSGIPNVLIKVKCRCVKDNLQFDIFPSHIIEPTTNS